MQKFVDRMIEKYLTKAIERITLEVCSKHFDQVFKDHCDTDILNDTTIGATYRVLQEITIKEVRSFLDQQLEEVNVTKAARKENIFSDILWDLWYEFEENLYFDDYVESFIGDERYSKEAQLYKDGVLDENGDYIKR